MSARKLQVEIEKTFKKVTDGIIVFDEVYEKLNASASASQKEKLEGDLKTQIKKLQRLRDQIKTWASSNDIKDKKALIENRRLIEAKMEEFKAVEREMKIKAFSKEGLSIALKMDPKEKEKHDTIQWISSAVEELERQVELLEAETESLRATFKRGKRDLSKQSHLSELESRIETHRWHQERLELIMRRLENSQISPETINNIQDDIMYYVESSQDADFAEDMNIYDDLDLDDSSGIYDAERSANSSSPTSDDYSDKEDENVPVVDSPPPDESSPKDVLSTPPSAASVPQAHGDLKEPDLSSSPKENQQIEIDGSSKPQPQNSTPSFAKAAAVAAPSNPVSSVNSASIIQNKQAASPRISNASAPKEKKYAFAAAAAAAAAATSSKDSLPARNDTPASPKVGSNIIHSRSDTPGHSSSPRPQESNPVVQSELTEQDTKTGNDGITAEESLSPPPEYIQDLVGALDASKVRLHYPMDREKLTEALNISCVYVPDAVDAAKPKFYVPKDPYPVPHYYPQQPLPLFDSPEMMEVVDPDTLFYMFYYLPGTYQQYLAGRELKKQSWRFHKKYTTWFQRHEEPKMITDEYESGTYRYFDFEGDWVQRKKADFHFMYEYLEDDEDWSR
ncbi:CCR4-Not complex subunit Not3/5 [Schizosaccharomyces cryophilus OY26]|uniref:General negative regulator of transcription subunit n=1 Tax=Schizosaccharomyces cryophilus (strain OY26 / ATCC MYA-4695 / CBS 11777 / NBRC 106824 / NRRL Y48691) TaxID=653667 RepID=S9W2E1_SCHCR|nr:CCR4-Not complex subunit Not3/5 [Schizosaccharomyces cryophilus OY26]EPY52564.1 CCR4-Not complex subunit Not3/5 [Schizosaccharomyces cryophilus OY26]